MTFAFRTRRAPAQSGGDYRLDHDVGDCRGGRELLVGTDGSRILRYSTELVPLREEPALRGPIIAIAPGVRLADAHGRFGRECTLRGDPALAVADPIA